jgi:hypothetical protein
MAFRGERDGANTTANAEKQAYESRGSIRTPRRARRPFNQNSELENGAIPARLCAGNTIRFYEWLESLKDGTLPSGPPVWICGDCHIGNLGPLANATGRIEIQIRDLDQTVVGNPAHDLIRR